MYLVLKNLVESLIFCFPAGISGRFSRGLLIVDSSRYICDCSPAMTTLFCGNCTMEKSKNPSLGMVNSRCCAFL